MRPWISRRSSPACSVISRSRTERSSCVSFKRARAVAARVGRSVGSHSAWAGAQHNSRMAHPMRTAPQSPSLAGLPGLLMAAGDEAAPSNLIASTQRLCAALSSQSRRTLRVGHTQPVSNRSTEVTTRRSCWRLLDHLDRSRAPAVRPIPPVRDASPRDADLSQSAPGRIGYAWQAQTWTRDRNAQDPASGQAPSRTRHRGGPRLRGLLRD